MIRLWGENVGLIASELIEFRLLMPTRRGDLEQGLEKFVEPGARHDHRIAPSVRFLADTEEATASILAVIDDQKLALHLELAGRDDLLVNHFGVLRGKEPRLMPQHRRAANGKFRLELPRTPCLIALPMRRLVILVLCVLSIVSAWLLWPVHHAPVATASPGGNHTPSLPTPPPSPAPPVKHAAETATAQFEEFVDRLQRDPASAREVFTALRAYLRSLPPEVAVATIRAFLDSARDIAVPLDFTLTADGSLSAAPTLRVWLLDTLTLVAPQAAADYAQRILATSASSDEWAISLRAYAIGRPDDAAFLKAKAGEMLARTDWREKPSAGYLEAFDVIVHTQANDFAPRLAQLVQDKNNRAVGHAAFLTLDRLIQQNPAATLTQLQAQPDLMAGREQTRANYFARADVRDPQQRTLLETYLLDPRRTPEELETFAGIYPNANFMVSNNLLTRTATPAGEDLAAHDREALRVVESWLADPRFAAQRTRLEAMQRRLREFVK